MTDNAKIEEERDLIKKAIGPAIGYRAIYSTRAASPGFAVTLFVRSKYFIESDGTTTLSYFPTKKMTDEAKRRIQALTLSRKAKVTVDILPESGRQYERWSKMYDALRDPSDRE